MLKDDPRSSVLKVGVLTDFETRIEKLKEKYRAEASAALPVPRPWLSKQIASIQTDTVQPLQRKLQNEVHFLVCADAEQGVPV